MTWDERDLFSSACGVNKTASRALVALPCFLLDFPFPDISGTLLDLFLHGKLTPFLAALVSLGRLSQQTIGPRT